MCAGNLLLEVESEGEVHRRFMLGVSWAGQEGRGAGWCWTLACKDLAARARGNERGYLRLLRLLLALSQMV